ncbi:MAG: ABC transporter ATP-binding protein [Candidatus Pelethousia sp.]|nr:ABC transporter ATP-binding protein [Candidatus Pelethousia sp.]
MPSTDILKMENITKRFGAMLANDRVSIDVGQGEILALLGENGAGKSTLMNILYGLYKPTSGSIYWKGKPVTIDSPLKAIEMGIGMVHQHFMLIPALKTWENVILGLKDEQKHLLHPETAKQKILKIAAAYNLQIDPNAKINTLSVGLQQQVEILKVLYRGSKLLILDEPTGVLTPPEKEKLFETLKSLAKNGFSVIFISHKLDEVMEISDRVSVLCRGKNVATVPTKEMTKEHLARLMVGRDVVFTVEKNDLQRKGDTVLEIESLCVQGERLASTLQKLSLQIQSGEIYGIAGVDGNGQSELMEAIAGLRKVNKGAIRIDSKDATNCSPAQIIRYRTAFIPEDRKQVGTVKSFGIEKNMILRDVDNPKHTRYGLINYKKIQDEADEVIEEYDIRLLDRESPVGLLSGGNLQKVILAREIRSQPRLLLAMHPTRGLDVGAIEFIHKKLLEAREQGAAILLISSELEEIMTLSDRVVVMCNGKISHELAAEDITIENIGLLMGGEETLKGRECHGQA